MTGAADMTVASDAGATAKPLVERIAAAIEAGARSWSAVGREAGVSRQWACQVGRAAGLHPDPGEHTAGGGRRAAKLSVRVHGAALEALDAYAAAQTARTGRACSRSAAARALLAAALAGG